MKAYLTNVRGYQTLVIPVVVVIGLLFLLFGLSEFSDTYFQRYEHRQSTFEWRNAFGREMMEVERHARELASSDTLSFYLDRDDSATLLGYAVEENELRGLGSIIITDKNGFVVSRTRYPTMRGDYLPGTSPASEQALMGHGFTSIESGFDSSLYLLSGQPVMKEGRQIGAVFAAQILDSAYAQKIRNAYFGAEMELAFFSKKEGFSGSSFDDPEAAGLLSAYLNIPSPEAASEISNLAGQRIALEGKRYIVHIVSLQGSDEEMGSIIIFRPVSWTTQAILLISVAILFFIFMESLIKRKLYPNSRVRNRYIVLMIAIGIFAAIVTARFLISDYKTIDLSKPPFTIYNATMDFHPSSGIFSRLYEQKIALRVTTGGERINSALASVIFDPSVVRVTDILTDRSFCLPDLFIEQSIDNEKGEVRIACGIPTPGISGETTILAELVIQPLQEKEFSLRFGEDTQVLADDGLGSNVLRSAQPSGYHISGGPKVFVDGMPQIMAFSPTHPNGERWHNSQKALFTWPYYGDFEYNHWIDGDPESEGGSQTMTTRDSFAELDILEEGDSYFHVMARQGQKTGPITTYRVRIDTEPPAAPEIIVSKEEVKKGEIVRFLLTSTDDESGLQGGFYIKFFRDHDDESIFLPVAPPVFLPFLQKGDFKVRVRVYDKAGNYSEKDRTIRVK